MEKTIEIMNETGLHARPASEFAKLATKMSCSVHIEKEGKRVDGKSIIGIMSLGVGKGSALTLITEGNDEANSMEALVSFVTNLKE